MRRSQWRRRQNTQEEVEQLMQQGPSLEKEEHLLMKSKPPFVGKNQLHIVLFLVLFPLFE